MIYEISAKNSLLELFADKSSWWNNFINTYGLETKLKFPKAYPKMSRVKKIEYKAVISLFTKEERLDDIYSKSSSSYFVKQTYVST